MLDALAWAGRWESVLVRQFSLPHVAALAVWVIATAACVNAGRRARPGARWTGRVRRVLAVLIAVAWAGEYVTDAILGTWSVQFALPLQLTDAVSLVAIYALLTERLWAVELAYYWAFTATLQAVLTPDLGQDFPDALYFTYFGYHLGALVGAAFLVWGLGLRPRPGAMWRAFAATLAWACVAGVADVITGGNYMYLAWKPRHASLLNHLGPWPWYVGAGLLVALVMLAIVSAVTAALERLVDRAQAPGQRRSR